jgi:hypothetical protein
VALVEESKIGLVGEGGGLQRVAGALVSQIGARETAHLFVDEREQRMERACISLPPAKKGLSDFRRGRSPLTPRDIHRREQYTGALLWRTVAR